MLRTDCFGVRHNAAATRSIIKIYPSPKYVQENGRRKSAVLLFICFALIFAKNSPAAEFLRGRAAL